MYRSLRPIFKPTYSIVQAHMKRNINTSVQLTDTENKIKDLLIDFCNDYNRKLEDQSKSLVLRITGGWVRDKLLGDHSNDLDIAINSMSGEEFVGHFTKYVSSHHPNVPLNSMHTIKLNPEKSKHLETCTTKIYGLDIDFVNLRSEEYTEDSRIPTIEYGTPKQDALRRDATLNSLFYNLNEQKIEDFTTLGIQDLENGILRTPLAPLKTFVDDPLRVLRLVRFASRFNFSIEHDTLQAMKNEDIKHHLLHKISRERVGTELEKILLGNNPEYGLNLLNYVGISDAVFNIGVVSSQLNDFNDTETIDQYYGLNKELYSHIYESVASKPLLSDTFESAPLFKQSVSKVSPKVFWLGVVLLPFKNLYLKISNKKAVTNFVPEIIIKEGLRYGKLDYEPVAKALRSLGVCKTIMEKTLKDDITRSELGLYLREFGGFSDFNFVINFFDDISKVVKVAYSEGVPDPVSSLSFTDEQQKVIIQILQNYEKVLQKIEELELHGVETLKPIVDGKTISKALDKKPGPWMSQVTNQVLIWQLDHPHGTTEECVEHLKHSL